MVSGLRGQPLGPEPGEPPGWDCVTPPHPLKTLSSTVPLITPRAKTLCAFPNPSGDRAEWKGASLEGARGL